MSEAKLYLKPQPGFPVRLTDGTDWPEDGQWADMSDQFIRRRVADGDLVEAPAPKAVKAAPAPAATPDIKN